MRRTVLLAAAALLLALLIASAARAEVPRKPAARWASCRYQSSNPYYSWSRWEVRQTIRCAADKWPVNVRTAMAIAQRESGFYAWVHNASSNACGIYQWMPSWWPHLPDMARLNGVRGAPACENARTNVLAAIHYAHENGWGPWSLRTPAEVAGSNVGPVPR